MPPRLGYAKASQDSVSGEFFKRVRRHFADDKELVDLAMAVITLHRWNHLAVSFRAMPGTYPTPPRH